VTGGALENAGWVALIAIVPLLVLMLTSFVKVSVVLSLLRNAIGATDAPSGLVVMGVSLVLTFFVMAPVAVEMVQAAAGAPATQPGPAHTPRTPQQRSTSPLPPPGTATPAGDAGRGAADAELDPNATDPLVTPGMADALPNAADPLVKPGRANALPSGDEANATPNGIEANAMPNGTVANPAGAPRATPGAGSGAANGAGGPPLELEAALREVVPPRLIGELDAVARGLEPLRRFLGRHAAERDRETFVELAGRMGHATVGDELWVLAPAFLTTELREAFAIAVLIFLPFLVIDLVVALSLAALGLQSTSPQVVALPLKLLLFVAVDGWRLLIESLLRGYV